MENVFSSIKVHIPKRMIVLKKNGKAARVDSLTKSGNIKKVDGEPAIDIIAEGTDESYIEDHGRYESFDHFLRAPYRIKPIEEPTEEQITFDYMKNLLKEKPVKKVPKVVVGVAKPKKERRMRIPIIYPADQKVAPVFQSEETKKINYPESIKLLKKATRQRKSKGKGNIHFSFDSDSE